ncbi:MAG TPA: ABC transporter substrate-binding protein [Candidatus Dormibacteraeota bacterium]|nr:ABC transporter substrate-binding protein [Candidatus Dormibacteraeota bacterium]
MQRSGSAGSGASAAQRAESAFLNRFLGGNGFNTAAVSKQAGQAGLGAQSGSAWYPGINTQSNRDFIAHYKAKYGADPDQLAAQAYTGVMILADAASRANLTFKDVAKDRTSMRDAMLATNLSDTPLGPFKFTSSHDVKQTIYVVAMDGKGGFTLVSTVPL